MRVHGTVWASRRVGIAWAMTAEHVLVVEDQRDIRDFVALVLESEGYRVSTADNGAVALEQVAREPVDVVLLDMRMPVMDGWAFARAYRERPGPHSPIVVLTASRKAADWAAEVEADEY